MKKQDLFWQTYLNIEKSIIDLSKYIYISDVIVVNQNGTEVEQPCPSQLETFSPFVPYNILKSCHINTDWLKR